MTERARIIAIDDDVTTLEGMQPDNCDGCSSFLCNTKTRTFKAVLPPEIDAKIGDDVEVLVPPAKAIAVGFAVLIVPLLLFVAGYLALGSTGSEPLQVAGGFGGVILGFVVVGIFGRKNRPELPRITTVYTEPTLQPLNIGS